MKQKKASALTDGERGGQRGDHKDPMEISCEFVQPPRSPMGNGEDSEGDHKDTMEISCELVQPPRSPMGNGEDREETIKTPWRP
ncbi:hypothetical protein RRG08_038633 [Elysia crispata]|uniref:Uncharacterized protein n=1 Tax=Elysia crispata TaxID=231223 RepID=A0AAE0YKV8_9GAST|nr:hypothetical protein RRG08_038633 [Elysia crispata]